MDSTSLIGRSASGLVGWLSAVVMVSVVMGTPSTTYRGWLLAETDDDPLILIFIVSPSLPLACSINTPDVLPWMADSKLATGISAIPLVSTFVMAPVSSRLIAEPYPTTTT